jgi:hypothetical protein
MVAEIAAFWPLPLSVNSSMAGRSERLTPPQPYDRRSDEKRLIELITTFMSVIGRSGNFSGRSRGLFFEARAGI